MSGAGLHRRRQRGVALIVALLVLAIAAGLAATMISDNQRAIDRTQTLMDSARADQLVSSGLVLAQTLLDKDNQDVDSLQDVWAKPYDAIPVDQGQVSLRIVDLQGRFNINSLLTADGKVDPLALERFKKLLQLVQVDPARAGAIIDWIDANQEASAGGAEDGVYQGRTPSSLAANRPIRSVTALRAVAGMTAQDYARLAPYVSALPVGAPINLNDADPVVLKALGAKQPPSTDTRPNTAGATDGSSPASQTTSGLVATSVANFLALPVFAGTKIESGGLSVNSHYFLCAITVKLGTVVRHRYAVLERGTSNGTRIIAMSNQACLTGHFCI